MSNYWPKEKEGKSGDYLFVKVTPDSKKLVRIKDRTGIRLGKLMFIRLASFNERPGKFNQFNWWLAKCDCGVEKFFNLSTYVPKSCGCSFPVSDHIDLYTQRRNGRKHKLEPGLSAKNGVYKNYLHNAKDRGHDFSISQEDFVKIASQPCYYCGEKWSIEEGRSLLSINGTWKRNGLDRKNNSMGYLVANCVPCCKRCNQMKSQSSYQDFINRIHKICERHPKVEDRTLVS